MILFKKYTTRWENLANWTEEGLIDPDESQAFTNAVSREHLEPIC